MTTEKEFGMLVSKLPKALNEFKQKLMENNYAKVSYSCGWLDCLDLLLRDNKITEETYQYFVTNKSKLWVEFIGEDK